MWVYLSINKRIDEHCVLFYSHLHIIIDNMRNIQHILSNKEVINKMNIFKNKLLWIAPIATMIILVIFFFSFYPAYNPKPKDLPIGILNEDKGTTIQDKNVNIGKN